MNIAKFSAVLVAGALSLAGASLPASAASLATNVFMNNVVPNVDFLDRSSRTALTNSKNARLRDFARAQATDQTLAANALDEWIEADKTFLASASPEEQVITGRSVAVTGQTAQIDTRLPLGQEDVDRLDGLTGTEFDSLYKSRQKDALGQIATSYADYIVKGDDPVLKGIAKRELPKVKHEIDVLNKI